MLSHPTYIVFRPREKEKKKKRYEGNMHVGVGRRGTKSNVAHYQHLHITNPGSQVPQESPLNSRLITPRPSGLHRRSSLSLHIIPMPLIYLVTQASPATHTFNTGPQPLQKVIENMGELHKSRVGRFNNVIFCF